VVGPTHQVADFLDVDQDRHAAALTEEPPFALELAIEDEPDDFLAGAAALLGRVRNVGLADSSRLHGVGAIQQLAEEGVQVLGFADRNQRMPAQERCNCPGGVPIF
jgi:hypothetical protein